MTQKELHNHWQELIGVCREVNWERPEVYACYMAQIFHFVKYSTRLLSHCASKFPLDQENPHQRFLEHIREENHHEKLALNDVKNMGFQISDFPEFAENKAFYLTQFALAELHSPLAFTGYAMLLEGMAVYYAPELYEIAAKNYGPKAGTFLKVHAAEDEDHLPQAIKMFEDAPRDIQAVIYDSFLLAKDLKATWVQKCSRFKQSGKIYQAA